MLTINRFIGRHIGNRAGSGRANRMLMATCVVVGGVSIGIAALRLAASAYGKNRVKSADKQPTSKRSDAIRDKTLKDSFPASDPPASQYFGIPVNHQ